MPLRRRLPRKGSAATPDGGGVHVVGSRHVRLRHSGLKPRQSFLPLVRRDAERSFRSCASFRPTAFPTSGACLPADRTRYAVTGRLALRPVPALEMFGQAIRDKARALRIDVPVAEASLTMGEEPLGNHEMQLVLCPRHGHVEQPSLFLNFER